jgi:hypothetical protein
MMEARHKALLKALQDAKEQAELYAPLKRAADEASLQLRQRWFRAGITFGNEGAFHQPDGLMDVSSDASRPEMQRRAGGQRERKAAEIAAMKAEAVRLHRAGEVPAALDVLQCAMALEATEAAEQAHAAACERDARSWATGTCHSSAGHPAAAALYAAAADFGDGTAAAAAEEARVQLRQLGLQSAAFQALQRVRYSLPSEPAPEQGAPMPGGVEVRPAGPDGEAGELTLEPELWTQSPESQRLAAELAGEGEGVGEGAERSASGTLLPSTAELAAAEAKLFHQTAAAATAAAAADPVDSASEASRPDRAGQSHGKVRGRKAGKKPRGTPSAGSASPRKPRPKPKPKPKPKPVPAPAPAPGRSGRPRRNSASLRRLQQPTGNLSPRSDVRRRGLRQDWNVPRVADPYQSAPCTTRVRLKHRPCGSCSPTRRWRGHFANGRSNSARQATSFACWFASPPSPPSSPDP